jgi:hypothetical protein
MADVRRREYLAIQTHSKPIPELVPSTAAIDLVAAHKSERK